MEEKEIILIIEINYNNTVKEIRSNEIITYEELKQKSIELFNITEDKKNNIEFTYIDEDGDFNILGNKNEEIINAAKELDGNYILNLNLSIIDLKKDNGDFAIIDEKEKNEPTKNKKDFTQTKQYVKLKQEDIRNEDISQKVSTVLDKGISKEEMKKNVQNLINDDIEKQNESWKTKIKSKKKKNLRTSYMENIGMNVLKKRVGIKIYN